MKKERRKIPLIAIVGPTASGKTALSIAIAKKIGGEVISADSRQVYHGLDIGTGKATKKEMRGIPHHLLDVADPKRQYTITQWVKSAETTIREINTRGNIPIICGGTGFYIHALLLGQTLPDVPPDMKLRKTLSMLSTEKLFAMLKRLDPKRARDIDAKNPRRLIRAIEIAKSLGAVPPQKSHLTPYTILWIGIHPDNLRERIHQRLMTRMNEGMLQEARTLHQKGLSYRRMRELGLEYRWMVDLLEKKITTKEFLAGLEKDIWRYAKRQMTWFKRNDDIHWISSVKEKSAEALVHDFLK